MFNYQFNSLSTRVKISISREMYAHDMLPVYNLFRQIEDTCSRFRQDSEISCLNRQVGNEVKISTTMYSILKAALQFYKKTDGIFNPGIFEAIETSGYSKSIELVRGQNLFLLEKETMPIVGQPIELNENKQSVILFTRIDLGGIAKGWVIEQAAEYLGEMGYGFINVGGDIRIFGKLPRSLNIGIENPFEPTMMISSIQVETGAVATSTSMKRRWMVNGEWKHHLIDPRTGEPSNSSIVSATVTAPTALEADVLAKTVLISGEGESVKNAVLIKNSGEIIRR